MYILYIFEGVDTELGEKVNNVDKISSYIRPEIF